MKKIPAIIALAVFIGYINLFLFRSWELVTLGWLLIGLLIWLWVTFRGRRDIGPWWFWVVGGLLFVGILMRGNPLNQLFGIGGLVVLGCVLTYVRVTTISTVRNFVEVVLLPFRLVIGYLLAIVGRLEALAGWQPTTSVRKPAQLRTVFVGGVFGLAGVVAIGLLLASGDAVFGSMVSNWLQFKINVPPHLGERLVFSGILFLMGLPVIYLTLKREFVSPTHLWQRVVGSKEAMIGVSMVALLLGLFLIVQWPYLFANVPAETALKQFGVETYSAYVRKGFIELVLVTILGYGMAGLAYVSWSRSGARDGSLRIVQAVLLGELLLFAVSILRRVWLYQEFHGWSLIRIYGSIFVIWMMVMFGILLARHFHPWRWVRLEMGIAAVFLIFAVWFNVEHFVVRTHPPTVNGTVDAVYLSRMSSDGYEGWYKGYQYVKNTVSDELLQKPIVTRDERRQVAYAWVITVHLASEYMSLVHRYGTVEERNAYYLDVARVIKATNQQWLQSPLASMQKFNYLKDTAIQQSNMAENYLQKKGNECVSVNAAFFQPFSGSLPYGYQMWCYDRTGVERKWWDQFISYNWGEATAYARFQREIGYQSLHALMEKLAGLYIKVGMQPENERDYEVDISTDAPLLVD